MTIPIKPELLVSAKNLKEITLLIEAGADAINIGSEKYGLRMPGNFSLEMIKEAVQLAHRNNVKIYVSMNALLHNQDLEGIEDYVRNLDEFGVDAIVFGDPAVLLTVKEIAPKMALHWNTETTSTNYQTVNYWAEKGATRAVLARELTLNEVIDVKNHVNVEVQAQVHGMTCIFHSKRELITSYLDYTNTDKNTNSENSKKTSIDSGLSLREHKRPDELYPVFEDYHGTHIMSFDDICMIENIGLLIDAGINSLKIEGIMKSTDYLVQVTKLYRQAINQYIETQENPSLREELEKLQIDNRPLSTGFYFKEQIY